MTSCKYIDKRGICRMKGCYATNHKCFGEDLCKCREPITNADRIRNMTDEELEVFLEDWRRCSQCHRRGNNCFPQTVDVWLQQPYKEG